ncbi:MAG TPA: hypothetical protein VFN75_10600 [Pseudonocardiaceae bacterium]|nr:hypothetical protein [Pseudonocardiaceae bacterium]
MNPLRALADWWMRPRYRVPGIYWDDRPLEGPPPPPSTPPPLSEHERLMRHSGRPECPIADHTDALRRLGRAILELDALRRQLASARSDRDEALAEHACWQTRAVRAETALERLEGDYRHLWDLHRQIVAERDRWRTQAARNEARLRHPSAGEAGERWAA